MHIIICPTIINPLNPGEPEIYSYLLRNDMILLHFKKNSLKINECLCDPLKLSVLMCSVS